MEATAAMAATGKRVTSGPAMGKQRRAMDRATCIEPEFMPARHRVIASLGAKAVLAWTAGGASFSRRIAAGHVVAAVVGAVALFAATGMSR